MTKMSLEAFKSLFQVKPQLPFGKENRNRKIAHILEVLPPTAPKKVPQSKRYNLSIWKWFKPQRMGSRKVGHK